MPRQKRWRDLSLRAKGVCVVAIPATATVAIASVSFALSGHVTRGEERVNQIRQACEEIQKMETLDAEAKADIRAYFMTGDAEFKLRLTEAISNFDYARRRLVVMTGDRAAQQTRLTQIDRMARSRAEHIALITAHFQSNTLTTSELRAAVLGADKERRQMETVIGAMLEEEKRALDGNLGRAAMLRAEIQEISAIFVIFGVVGGVVISVLFASGITFRIEKLKQNVAKLATGGVLDPMPQ